MDIGLVRYTNPFSVNPTWANNIMTSEQALNHLAQLKIDNQVAVFFVLNTMDLQHIV